MNIEYDPEADALYIRFRETEPTDNVDIREGLTVDFDDHQELVGIEILAVSRRLPREAIASITLTNIVATH